MLIPLKSPIIYIFLTKVYNMFCEKCGKEIPDGVKFCPSCGHDNQNHINAGKSPSKDKNLILALVISFLLTGLGIAYAGDKKKGIILFIVGLVLNIIGRAIPILTVAGIIVWAYGLYETYNQAKIANGVANPNLIEDIKSLPTPKKVAAIAVIAIIFLLVVGGCVGALMPKTYTSNDNNYNYDVGSADDSSSSGGSGSGLSYSSSDSSKGYDTHTHYEGEYGSSDTYGTVNDDGSVDSYQKGTTDYGDYEINSHMDSDGNIHGTVDVGGKTYHVDT